MFDFDELFNRRDPYGSFTAELEEQQDVASLGASCSIDALWDLRGTPRKELYERLIKYTPGADLRPIALSAAHGTAILVDVQEVFQITAASVSMRLAGQRDFDDFRGWLHGEALRAVDACIMAESERHTKNVELAYPLLDHYACVREVLDVPLARIRYAVTCINLMPLNYRFPFMRILLQGTRITRVVLESKCSAQDLLANMQAAIEHLQELRINKEA